MLNVKLIMRLFIGAYFRNNIERTPERFLGRYNHAILLFLMLIHKNIMQKLNKSMLLLNTK